MNWRRLNGGLGLAQEKIMPGEKEALASIISDMGAFMRAMYKPMPRCGSALEAPGRIETIESKRRPRMFAGRAGPSLLTLNVARVLSACSSTVTGVSAHAKSTALATSLSSICAISSGAPLTVTVSLAVISSKTLCA
jgi:hypothetical protein